MKAASTSRSAKLLESLNPEQAEAVTAEDSPLLVLAGAGTGKTLTLAHRVAHLVASGTDPGRILLLTFTRRAATEMLGRVDGILRRLERAEHSQDDTSAKSIRRAAASGRIWGGTFHSAANRLLRLHGYAVGLTTDFLVIDRADSEDLIGVARTHLRLADGERRFPTKGTCLDIYSRCVNAGEKLETVVAERFTWCRGHEDALGSLFDEYVDRKAAQGLLDYDDLLIYWRGLLAHPTEGPRVRGRFDRVLVDEYQDTNALQGRILELLRPEGHGLTAVGDDAQAIYGFRAATVRNILDLPTKYPGARVVTLRRNYRSTPQIVEATNRVISLAAERHPKELVSARERGETPRLVECSDEDGQASFVADSVLRHREEGVGLRRQAVLFRASHHSLELEMELTRRDIPFHKYGGLRFAETAHVKDLLSVLRLAENPRDMLAGTRLLLLLPGIGPARANSLVATLRSGGGSFELWRDSAVPAPAQDIWPDLVGLLQDLAGTDRGNVGEQVRRARELLAPLIESRYREGSSRIRDLEQLEYAATRHEDRARFLSEMALDPPSWTEDLAGPPHLDDDWLVLSTMHSAKGLEWDVVFVLHAADGNIPSDMATGSADEIEEERRLFYVACTRARDALYVCHPLRYYKAPRGPSDTHGYSQLTRFMPGSVSKAFSSEVHGQEPGFSPSPSRGTPDEHAGAELREEVKSLW